MFVPICGESEDRVLLRFSPTTCNCWHSHSHSFTLTPLLRSTLESGARVSLCFSINGIYFKSRQMGLSITCTDMLIQPAVVCPFHYHAALDAEHALPEHEDAPSPEEMAVISA